MKTILLAMALVLCSTAALAYHDGDRSYYRGRTYILGDGGVYFYNDSGSRHYRYKVKRCWEHHGRTYCKYYYRDREHDRWRD